jgi:hypothetical protein
MFVLTPWKEIAQYANKGVRTVQRWERELRFPVRRTKYGTKSSVLAVPREIDAWGEIPAVSEWAAGFCGIGTKDAIPGSEGAAIGKSKAPTPTRIRASEE